MSPPTNNWR